jgi:hypothetical protein
MDATTVIIPEVQSTSPRLFLCVGLVKSWAPAYDLFLFVL